VVGRERRIGGQRQVGEDRADEEERPDARPDEHRVLPDPAEPGALCELALGNRAAVHVGVRNRGATRAQPFGQPVEPGQCHLVVILASRVLRDAWGAEVGVGVRPVIVLQQHDDGEGFRDIDPRILPALRLAMQVSHGAGVALGEPRVEPIGVGRRTRVGDSAGQESELEGARPELLRERHVDEAGIPTGGSDALGICHSWVMRRAPRLYVT
jgi:hypothetical protein